MNCYIIIYWTFWFVKHIIPITESATLKIIMENKMGGYYHEFDFRSNDVDLLWAFLAN